MPDRPRSRPAPALLLGLACALLGQGLARGAEDPRQSDLVARSLELFRQGDCAAAKPVMEQVLSREPKNIAVRKLLGRCFLKDGRWEEARAQFQRALDTAPQDSAAFEGLRSAVAEIQKQEQIRQTLAIESRQSVAEKLEASHAFQEAEELIKAYRLTEAERILADVVKKHPDSAPAAERLAEIYSTTKRFDQAAALYESLLERTEASALYRLRLAQNQAWAAHYPEALANYQLYVGQKPEDADGRLGLASTLTMLSRCAEAVDEFRRVLAARPKDLEARLGLARCYDQLSQPQQALQAYESVLELDPKSPGAIQARAQYQKYFDELARRKGHAALEQKDFEGAARAFEDYLKLHPDSAETVLQAARAWSWAQRVPEAERHYQDYLRRQPGDRIALRELAKIELWSKSYAAARERFTELVGDPAATTEDYEALVHAFTWDGDFEGAELYARRLAEMAPDNAVAKQALADLRERRRLAARNAADALAVAGRLPEAATAYSRYLREYGKDPMVQREIGRLLARSRRFDAAEQAYQDYLRDYPQDVQARVELANVEIWAGLYPAAEAEYRAILQADPGSVPALLGLAQIMDYRGDDRFRVLKSYKKVLGQDPANDVARQKVDELHVQVAPGVTLLERGFKDTDDFTRSVSAFELSFPVPGRVRLTPFYAFEYFEQRRHVPGEAPEVQALNREIDERDGTTIGHGGGARLEASSGVRWSWLGEAMAVRFDSGQTSVNARGEMVFRTRSDRTAFVLDYVRRDAVHDLDNLAPLVAEITGDTVVLAWRQSLGRLRLWSAGGIAYYSAGADPWFLSNTQRRVSARLEFAFNSSNRVGYYYRLSRFDRRSPLYFSPASYRTLGATVAFGNDATRRFHAGLDGEIGYSRIDGSKNLELSARPGLSWKMRPNLALRLGYRYSRSRTSLFGSATYGSHGFDFGLNRVF